MRRSSTSDIETLSCCWIDSIVSTMSDLIKAERRAHLGQEVELDPSVRLDQVDEILRAKRSENVIDVVAYKGVVKDSSFVFCGNKVRSETRRLGIMTANVHAPLIIFSAS